MNEPSTSTSPEPTPAASTAAEPSAEPSAQPDVAEAASPSEQPAPVADPQEARLSARFAALSRKEKSLREQERRVKEAEQRLRLLDDQDRLAKEDPLALLDKLGITYEQLTDHVLGLGAPKDPLALVQQKLDALERQRAEEREQAQRADTEQKLNQFKRTIRATIDTDADKYELIAAEEAYDDVYDLIEQHFEQTREVMPIERAAQLVEDHLYAEARKLTKAKKLRALLASDDAVRDTEQKKGTPGQANPERVEDKSAPVDSAPVTLTNGHVSVANPLPQAQRLSEEESKRRAAALLRWT